MNKLLKLIFSCVVFTWSSAWAVDTYNPANGQLTIPTVQVGTTTFTNVVITVGSIVSVGNGSASGQVDTYDSKTNQLTIPSVVVGSTTYNNVVITVGSVISVGGTSSYIFDLTNRIAQAYPSKCSNGIVAAEIKFSVDGIQFLRGTDSVDENPDGTCTAKQTLRVEIGFIGTYADSKKNGFF